MAVTLLTLPVLNSVRISAPANLRSSRRRQVRLERQTRSLQEPTFDCPPDHSGYFPTADCKSYYWCTNGSPSSSILYSCSDELLFDVEKGRCDWKQTVTCSSLIPEDGDGSNNTLVSLEDQQWASTQIDFEAISKGESSLRLTNTPTLSPVSVTIQPTRAPVPYDPDNVIVEMVGVTVTGQYGEAIYFPDFANHCCRGEKEGDDAFKPTWMTVEHMFRSKERCCTQLFDWIDLSECLGDGFVELNLYGEAPQITKVDGPDVNTTTNESNSNTDDDPTSPPSSTTAPVTIEPSPGQSTATPTVRSTSSPISPRSSYIMNTAATPPPVELEEEMPYIPLVAILHPTPQPTSRPTRNPTSKPTNDPTKSPTVVPTTASPTVSMKPSQEAGIAIQALADATVSEKDSNNNYGSHTMLVVDGGTGGPSSRYDSLLNFDIAFLESGVEFGKVFLRMFVKDAGGDFCGKFETIQNPYWNEESVTWMNAPTSTTGVSIGEAWDAKSGEWFELEVTGALKWVLMHDKQKLLSIRISSTVARRCIFASNNDPGHAPHLFARYSKQDTATSPLIPGSTSPPTPGSISSPTPESNGPRQSGEALMLIATDDATITKEDPDVVSGKEATLVITDNGSLTQDILIKFDIKELRKSLPRSGVLMMHLPQSCMSAGVFVCTTRNDGWTEDTVTWSTAPTFESDGSGTKIGTFGELEGGKYVAFDVMSALSWNTVTYQESITFRISSDSGHACEYTSKEGGQPPKLVIEF